MRLGWTGPPPKFPGPWSHGAAEAEDARSRGRANAPVLKQKGELAGWVMDDGIDLAPVVPKRHVKHALIIPLYVTLKGAWDIGKCI